MASIAHDIPGRLRLVLPWLRGNPDAAESLCRRLRQAAPVISASANAAAGSLVVRYDGPDGREKVLAALALPEDSGARGTALADAIAGAAAEYLARWVVRAVVSALA